MKRIFKSDTGVIGDLACMKPRYSRSLELDAGWKQQLSFMIFLVVKRVVAQRS